ncbi:MAG: hypothetical protein P8105_07810, partial [Dehalococcoidia bacterium]
MKVLLAVNGSPYTERVVNAFKALKFNSGTEVVIVTVVPSYTFLGDITLTMLNGVTSNKKIIHEAQEKKATDIVNIAKDMLKSTGLDI